MRLAIWGAALSVACGAQAFVAQVRTGCEPPPHRVLFSIQSDPGDHFPRANYWVRVESLLTEEDFKRVVCAVIRQESPAPSDYLAVSLFLRLDSYHLVETRETAEKFLGDYLWNRKLPANRYRLMRIRDENGDRIPYEARFSEFDHVRDCPRILK